MKIRKCKYNILSRIGGVCILYDYTYVAREELESIHTTHEAILFVENVYKSWKTFFFRIFYSTFIFFFLEKLQKLIKTNEKIFLTRRDKKKGKGKWFAGWWLVWIERILFACGSRMRCSERFGVCVFEPSCRDDVLFNKLKLFKDLWNSWRHKNRRSWWW